MQPQSSTGDPIVVVVVVVVIVSYTVITTLLLYHVVVSGRRRTREPQHGKHNTAAATVDASVPVEGNIGGKDREFGCCYAIRKHARRTRSVGAGPDRTAGGRHDPPGLFRGARHVFGSTTRAWHY